MTTSSRRKFIRNAGLGITGFTILPEMLSAKGTNISNDEDCSLGNGTQAIEDDIDIRKFIEGKSKSQVEDLSLGQRNQQYAEIFEEGDYLLQNDHISRAIDWKNGFVKTTSIKNKFAGEIYQVEGEEFIINVEGIAQPLTTKDFAVKNTVVATLDKKTQIVLSLNSNKIPDLNIKLIYELKDSDFFGRKWLVLEPNPHTEFDITAITVESLTFPSKVNCSNQGNGQPVYIDNLFMGLEWPTADNSFKDGKYSSTHWPAWNVGKATNSKIAVWGATPENEVSNWFIEKYVPGIRGSAPNPY